MAEERFETRLAQVGADLRNEIAQLDTKIEKAKADLIKWMFIFIFGQFWAIIGTLFVFFKS